MLSLTEAFLASVLVLVPAALVTRVSIVASADSTQALVDSIRALADSIVASAQASPLALTASVQFILGDSIGSTTRVQSMDSTVVSTAVVEDAVGNSQKYLNAIT